MENDVEQTLAQVEAGEAPVCYECVENCSDFADCPRCLEDNGPPRKMQRVIGPVGFSLKGGGWASEGYSSKPKVDD